MPAASAVPDAETAAIRPGPRQTDYGMDATAVCEGETSLDERLHAVAAAEKGLAARIAAMLDEIVRLNAVDPTFTRFPQTAAVGNPWEGREEMFRELFQDAIAAGELGAADLETTVNTMSALTAGLMVIGNLGPEAQARAVEGLKRLLRGTLLGPS